MSGVSVGSISVSLGVNLAEFDSGLRKAADDATTHVGRISSGMKQSSREGAESLRLIDEALGVHLSRPLTNILTKEFPAFAAGLQAILGGAVFGALATVGVEFGEKIAKSIEKAAKAQQEFNQAQEKAKNTFTEIVASYAESEKKLGLTGISKKLFEIDSESIAKGRSEMEKLAKAQEEVATKAQAAAGWWSQTASIIETLWHQAFSFQSTLNLEEMNKQLPQIEQRFNDLSLLDGLKGTNEGAKFLQQRLDEAQAKLNQMNAQNIAAAALPPAFFTGPHGVQIQRERPSAPNSQDELSAQAGLVKFLKERTDLAKQIADLDKGDKSAAGAAAAKEANDKLIRSMEESARAANREADGLTKMLQAAMPAKDGITQLDEAFKKEMTGLRELTFLEGAADAQKRLGMSFAEAALQLRNLNLEKESAAQLDSYLQKGIPGVAPRQAGAPAPPGMTAATGAPTVAAQYGGSASAGIATMQAAIDAFAHDSEAQTKLISSAFMASLSPLEKYNLEVAKIKIAFEGLAPALQNTAAATAAFKAEMQKASDEFVKADEHIRKLKEDMDKMLERSGSASAGFKAFWDQMQIEGAEKGKSTFDALNAGMKGWQDNLITMIEGGRTHWRQYFTELETMGLKFALTQGMTIGTHSDKSTTGASLLGGILGSSNPLKDAAGAVKGAGMEASSTALAAGAATLTTGSTLLQTASLQLSAAATALQVGGGGGGGFSNMLDLIPHAAGGDVTPGQSYLVGEKGPEVFSSSVAGDITPNSALGNEGRAQHIYHIDARGADAGVEQRVMRAMRSMSSQAEQRAVTTAEERGKRRRG